MYDSTPSFLTYTGLSYSVYKLSSSSSIAPGFLGSSGLTFEALDLSSGKLVALLGSSLLSSFAFFLPSSELKSST